MKIGTELWYGAEKLREVSYTLMKEKGHIVFIYW